MGWGEYFKKYYQRSLLTWECSIHCNLGSIYQVDQGEDICFHTVQNGSKYHILHYIFHFETNIYLPHLFRTSKMRPDLRVMGEYTDLHTWEYFASNCRYIAH